MFEETTLQSDLDNSDVSFTVSSVPKVGDTCIVTFNGTKYTCTAIDATTILNAESILLGNYKKLMGTGDSGEPFMIAIEPTGEAILGYVGNDGLTTFTLSIAIENIHKIPNKFVPTLEEMRREVVLPTTTEEVDAETGMAMLPAFQLVADELYNISYNGIEYNCKCINVEGMFMLGNYGIEMGTGDTGEPFVIACQNVDGETMCAIMPLDGETSITISISIIHKLDKKFLPDDIAGGADWNANEGEAGYIKNRTHYDTISEIYPETTMALDSGGATLPSDFILELNKQYIISWNGTPYTCTAESVMIDTEMAIVVGNIGVVMGIGSDTGEPFVIGYVPSYNMILVQAIDNSLTSVNLKIEGEVAVKLPYKYLPDDLYRSEMKVLLPESTLTFNTADGDINFMEEQLPFTLTEGTTYCVFWNGTPYTVIAQLVGLTVGIGNQKALGGSDTGEPFAILSVNDDTSVICTVDGSTSANVKIEEENIVKVPEKYLPEMTDYAKIDDIPTALKNPYSLKFTGAVTGTYNGSTTVTINIPEVDLTEYVTETELNNKNYATKSEIPTTLKNPNALKFTGAVFDTYDGSAVKTVNIVGKAGTGTKSELFNDASEASNYASHAEGHGTTASGYASHAEGHGTTASGDRSHAEGFDTVASGYASHAEGLKTIASGEKQHVQGEYNIEDIQQAHIVGNGSIDNRSNAHTLDWDGNAWFAGDVYVGSTSGTNKDAGSKKLATEEYVDAANDVFIAEYGTTTYQEIWNAAIEDGKTVLCNYTLNNNDMSSVFTLSCCHIDEIKFVGDTRDGKQEVICTMDNVWSINDVAQSALTFTGAITNTYDGSEAKTVNIIGKAGTGTKSELFNNATEASGNYSHAEGSNTTASGVGSHAEGGRTTASGNQSHAEGLQTVANGKQSHAEGNLTTAVGKASHIEGCGDDPLSTFFDDISIATNDDIIDTWVDFRGFSTALGDYSHVEGFNCLAAGKSSHAEGTSIIANGENQHAQGRYNLVDTNQTYAHIVGNGDDTSCSNAHTLDWNGNAWFAGDVYVGSTSGTNKDAGSKKLIAAPTANTGDLLMYNGTNWVALSKADLIAEIIAALPSAEGVSF